MVEIVAEIGNTHEGSLQLAKCFISEAQKAGADSVKFQFHIFEEESLPNAPNPPYFNSESRKEYFERTSFSKTEWQALFDYSKSLGLGFYCSPFSIKAAEILNEVGIDGFKIASGEVTNLPMLQAIGRMNKRVILYSGMSTQEEVLVAKENLLKFNKNLEITALQCTSKYPCPPEDVRLDYLVELNKHFESVGFSDHTLSSVAACQSVFLGAIFVEKHFTLSKQMYGPDASFSLEPSELKRFVEDIKEAEAIHGSTVPKDNLDTYLNNMKHTFQKCIVSARELEAGTVIELSDLAFKKPSTGISAASFEQMLGKRIKEALPKDHVFCWQDFQN